MKMLNRDKNEEIKVSASEKEVLREIVQIERENVRVFSLPSKEKQARYEKMLDRLDRKLAT